MQGIVKSATVVICLIGIIGTAFAITTQSPIDQDWHQWSRDVCLKILTASPWVTTAQPDDPKDVRRAVLLSSLLVRQAMLRELQIQKKYDAMSPKKRQEFDQQTATCLTDPKYSNYIVLRVFGGPPVNPTEPSERAQLHIIEHNTIVGGVYTDLAPLTCGGDSFPWQYIPTAIDKFNDDWENHHPGSLVPENKRRFPEPASTLEFLYPRSVDGKPLIQPGDRTMVFKWGEKGGQFTFHLADLIYKDKLDF